MNRAVATCEEKHVQRKKKKKSNVDPNCLIIIMINIKWVRLATMEASQFDRYEIYLVDACKGFLHLYLAFMHNKVMSYTWVGEFYNYLMPIHKISHYTQDS